MDLLNREQILQAKLPTERVNIPEWGGDVIIRTLTGSEFEEWENTETDSKNKQSLAAKLCVMCIIDEQGQQIFNEKDIDKLSAQSGKALLRIFEAAVKLNGIDVDAVENAKKNSEPIPA